MPGVPEQELADVERLNFVVDESIVVHKYLGDYLPTKRGKGLDWTLGADAVRLGQKTGYDYALFLHAEDQVASTGRVALGVLGAGGLHRRLLRAQRRRRGAARLCLAGRPQDRRGRVVQRGPRGSQVPGIKFGDLRTPQGAAQMVERLLGRMKPGAAVRRAQAKAR